MGRELDCPAGKYGVIGGCRFCSIDGGGGVLQTCVNNVEAHRAGERGKNKIGSVATEVLSKTYTVFVDREGVHLMPRSRRLGDLAPQLKPVDIGRNSSHLIVEYINERRVELTIHGDGSIEEKKF